MPSNLARHRDLATLLSPWIADAPSVAIGGITLDSRAVATGDVFVAMPGSQADGRDYIDMAIANNAAAVLVHCDAAQHGQCEQHLGVWLVYVAELNARLSAIAGRYYGDPAGQLTLVGVTGTNGKTTVTQLIGQWLTLLGHPCYTLGTLGNGLYGQLRESVNTTASAIAVQEELARAVSLGASHLVMEVSSHGLDQHRVADLTFDVALFTNLSRDHLDYHGDMASYGAAKRQLFSPAHCRQAVLNGADPLSAQWLADWPTGLPVRCFHASPVKGIAALVASDVVYDDQGIAARLQGPEGQGELTSRLLGAFNLDNLLAALNALLLLGHDLDTLLQLAPSLAPVAGRMDAFTAPGRPTAVVDYAHTPDALEKALVALRRHCPGQLWAVFGCGGDRDPGKRPMMARAAEAHADRLVVTSDNPRSESPQRIAEQVMAGLTHPEAALLELDRPAAVQLALRRAKAGDLVLLAGKGHEDYQLVGTKRLDYNERDWVKTLQESPQ